ncbi:MULTISPECIES: hypothetical protein [unclassified Curtobacterium]|uniref:hypothetical protein n=1 Tax=unclassified Curtobacterium TaxID=257496 RepID=UPI0039AF140E
MAVDLAPGVRDLRVAGPASAAWVCAAVLVGVPGSAGWFVLACAAVACGGIAWLLVGCPRRALGVVGLVVASAAFCTTVAVAVVVGDDRRSPAVLDGVRTAAVEIVLDRDLAPGDRSVVGTLVVAEDVDGLRVPVRVVPAAQGAPEAVAAGSRVHGVATLEADEPGSTTSFVAFLRGGVRTEPPTGLLAATDRARRAFVSASSTLPEPGASLLRGLAIGDRSGLDPATEAAMETSALTHLTAVSGESASQGDASPVVNRVRP